MAGMVAHPPDPREAVNALDSTADDPDRLWRGTAGDRRMMCSTPLGSRTPDGLEECRLPVTDADRPGCQPALGGAMTAR
jgi:hypothetical protein